MTAPPFGAILAGGRNSRYGSHKALATVAGRPIIDRVRAALRAATPDLILIANEPARYARLGLPLRVDAVSGLGALGGIYSALLWARAEERPGSLVVACDMPFLAPALLNRLLDHSAMAEIVVPESEGRRGIEPLCAYYGIGCIPAIEAAIGRGDRRVIGFYDELFVYRLPLDEVQALGDPALIFLNVNTREERERAEAVAGAASMPGRDLAAVAHYD